MMRLVNVAAAFALLGALAGTALVAAQEKKAGQDYEKKVKESDVPPAALAALKKLAEGAAFTEFAEEVEHGHKFYEGSWKGPDGNVDGLVSEAGDIVELEESIAPEKAPTGARTAAEREAGKDAKPRWERKTIYLYEIHFKKDGKGREVIFTADGRRFNEEAAMSPDHGGDKKGDDKDDDDDD